MCNAASDGDRYSGRKEPAEVRGGHGDGVAAAASFLCASLVRCDHEAKTLVPIQAPQAHYIRHTMRLMVIFTKSEDTNG